MAGDSDMEMKIEQSGNLNIDNYRRLVQNYINLHIYNSALFWADKVVALSEGNPKDIYWLAQCMYLLKQYHRAAHLLKTRNLDKTYILCNVLTVRCLLEANEVNEALKVVNSIDMDVFLQNTNTSTPCNSTIETALLDDTPKHLLQSSVLLIKGKVLEAMDNRGLASDCYKQALICDVHCYEAFEALIQHNMLTAYEEEALLDSLPLNQQCTTEEAEVLILLYKSKLKKYHGPSKDIKLKQSNNDVTLHNLPSVQSNPNFTTPKDIMAYNTPTSVSTPNINETEAGGKRKDIKKITFTDQQIDISNSPYLTRLQDSLDILVAKAERFYYDCDYIHCCALTDKVLKQDPYHNDCLAIHISCQVELKRSNQLFQLAHKLVDLYPNLAISWFAVGCYYYIINKSDMARRYLAKSASLDRLFGPAWLAYGHSFAMENEHDQAMAAYFKSSQLMKGCHLPLMYIGLECGLTNNVKLAEKFFKQAVKIAPNDPFVLHEMGVIAFQNTDFLAAEKYFKEALAIVRNRKDPLLPQRWTSLLNNLGHTSRKLKKYDDALSYHQEALLLSPQSAGIYSAIAYVHALNGELEEAVDYFHRALGLKRDDMFSTTMLNYVIEQLSEDQEPYPGCPDDIPDFVLSSKPEDDTSQDLQEEESVYPSNSNSNLMDMTMSIEMDMSENVKE